MNFDIEHWSTKVAPQVEEQSHATAFQYSTPYQPVRPLTQAERKLWFGEQERIENDREIMLARAEVREEIREKDKAIVDMVAIDPRGILTIETVNTRKKYAPRVGANFFHPKLDIFINEISGEKIYKVSFRVNQKEEFIVLSESEAGDPKVFLKKLNSVGANFAVKKTSEKKEFATQLWSLLLSNASITREIPDRVGWHKNSDGEIKFHEEGTLVWKFLIEIILKNS